MTTTLQAHGGGAQPASIDTSGKIAGGVALRVYGFDSAEDAQAAGYVCEGGPAMSVALITDAQIAAGTWKAEGDPSALAVYTAPANLPVEGGYALPVYAVNGWGSTPAPVAPLFDSAEIGTVNASTVAVTFDQDVSASDYSAGVTIKVNGSGATISSATRQANHAIVYYVLSAAVVFGDTVTWEYAQASGNIVAEDDSTPLANVTAQSVTNNVADTIGDTLRNDAVAYWAMNDASDSKGNVSNLTNNGPVTFVAGKVDNAASFDGLTQYFGHVSTPVLQVGDGAFTFCFWVKPKSYPGEVSFYILAKGTVGDEYGFIYETDLENIHTLGIYIVGGDFIYPEVYTNSDRQIDQWYFVTGGHDPVNGKIFIQVNDEAAAQRDVVSGQLPTDDPFSIGAYGDGSLKSDVDIDEVGFWKRVLTSDERDYLYNGGAGRALFPAP